MKYTEFLIHLSVIILYLDFSECYNYMAARTTDFGGHRDSNNTYPYIVSIESTASDNKPAPNPPKAMTETTALPVRYIRITCAGSLLTEDWVLTAAQCSDPAIDVIRFRDKFKPDTITGTSKIISRVFHPAYKTDQAMHTEIKFCNNIALFYVEKVSQLRAYAQIGAADYFSLDGLPVTITTYFNSNDKYEIGYNLYTVKGLAINCAQSRATMASICFAFDCSNKAMNTMSGTIGAPMIFNGKIVGFLFDGQQSRFLPVSLYLEWIHDTVQSVITPDN